MKFVSLEWEGSGPKGDTVGPQWIRNLNYSLNITGNCNRNKMSLRLGTAGNRGESRGGTWSKSHET